MFATNIVKFGIIKTSKLRLNNKAYPNQNYVLSKLENIY